MFKPDDFINRNLWGKRAFDALKIAKKAIQDAEMPTPLDRTALFATPIWRAFEILKIGGHSATHFITQKGETP